MENNSICNHDSRKKHSGYSFCLGCGSIIIGSAISLKPSRYNLLVEQSPLFFLEKMKAASSLTRLKTNTSYTNKREELIRNLRVLFNKLKFRNQTFYLAVLMMDLILCNHQETKLELVSVVCLILAAKFDENDPCIPDLVIFENLCYKNTFTADDIRIYECVCLKYLEYNLSYFTAYHYLCFFISHGIIFTDDFDESSPKALRQDAWDKMLEKICNTAKEVLFYFTQDCLSLQHSQLHIACSCVSICREIHKFKDIWPSYLSHVFGIKYEEFQVCSVAIQSVISKRAVSNSTIGLFYANKKVINQVSTPTNSSTISFKTSVAKNQFSLDQTEITKHLSFNSNEKESFPAFTHTKSATSYNSSGNRSDKRKTVIVGKTNDKILEKIKEENNYHTNHKPSKTIKLSTNSNSKVDSLMEILELKINTKDVKKRTLNGINVGLKSKEYSNQSVEKKDALLKKAKITSKYGKVSKASFVDTVTSITKNNFNNNSSIKNFRQLYSSRDNKGSMALLGNVRKESAKINTYYSNNDKTLQLEPKSKSIMVPDIKSNITDLKKVRYNSIRKKDIDKNLTQNIGNILKKVTHKSEVSIDFKSFYKNRDKSQQK